MRRLIPFICLFSAMAAAPAFAQQCAPDPQYADSTGFVFPPPYDPVEEPEGGIDKVACIGAYFEFQWTVNTPDTVLFPVFGIQIPVALEHLKLATSGAISNLPEGINYICNPPDCQFNVGSPGCVLLFGTPGPNVTPGTYNLAFTGALKTKNIGTQNVSFPDPTLYPGNYLLEVLAPEDPGCVTSIDAGWSPLRSHRMIPNPATDFTLLDLEASVAGQALFELLDVTGQPRYTWQGWLQQGRNQVEIPLYELPAGYWIYRVALAGHAPQVGTLIKASGQGR